MTAELGSPNRRNCLWWTLQVLMKNVLGFWLRYRARGLDRIPELGGGLILSNHQSFLDPLLIGLPLQRPVSFLARDTLFPIPVIGWILRNTYVMPLSRDTGGAAGIRETIRRMEEGFLVGVFPEGTRSHDGKLGDLKPGFAALVRRSDLPIYPVGIAGAYRALGKGSLFLKPCPVCVVFGEPIPPHQIAPLKQRGREQELVETVRNAIAACQTEAEGWLQNRANRQA
ncbi:MAG: 1-acyl-sn-glycerol-3-phosphate acyltransferase [Planctomycetes bacterium]|nr:1-acyl-sn-glycerol-3-phosphate acyltransferase [Planctomycetota bacterium]